MAAFFESRLEGYEEHMLNQIQSAREFYAFTAAQLPLEANSRILDLGCGTGLELEAYFSLNPSALQQDLYRIKSVKSYIILQSS